MLNIGIGVFFGSRSPEHDISIITGQLIIAGLKELGYQVIPVYLTKKGEWLIGEKLGDLKIFTDPTGLSFPQGLHQYYLDLEKSHGVMAFKKKGFIGKEIIINLAFPAFHGSFGEDGTIQGLFEMFDIPYVGCDVTSSAITMDKVLTKLLFKAGNFPTTDFIYFYKDEWLKNKKLILKEVREKLGLPVFVKPAKLGSSIGITKVKNLADLDNAIEIVLHYDLKCLVEKSVENMSDITCALLGNRQVQASLLQESLYHKDLFSYEDKYLKGGGGQLGHAKRALFIPARLDKQTTKTIQEMARQIYQYFGLSGTSRVDFLYDNRLKKFYANEINTLPGTLYHHLWEKSGIKLPELLTRLINLAMEKYQEKNSISYTFKSDVLRMLSSTKLKFKK